MARILEWFVISSTSGPHFVRTLHYDLSMLVGPAWHGTQFHWVTQALHHNKAVIHEGGKDMNSQLFKLSQIVDSFLLLLLLLFSLHEWGVCEEARFCNSVFLNKLQHFSEGSCVQLKAVPIVFFFFNLISCFWLFFNIFIFHWRIIKMPKYNFHILLSFSLVLLVGRLLGGDDFNDKNWT